MTDAGRATARRSTATGWQPAQARVTERDHIEFGRSLVVLRPPGPAPRRAARRSRDGAVEFNRPPRVARPTSRRCRGRAAALQAVRTRLRSPRRSRRCPRRSDVPAYQGPAMLLFSALSPVMALSTFISDRRGGRKKYACDLAALHQRIARCGTSSQELREPRSSPLRADAPRRRRLSPRAARHLPALWERRRGSPTSCRCASAPPISRPRSRSRSATAARPRSASPPSAIVASTAPLPSAPLAAKLPDARASGSPGPRERRGARPLARGAGGRPAQPARPADLRRALAGARSGLELAAWLPHAAPTRRSTTATSRSASRGRAVPGAVAASPSCGTRRPQPLTGAHPRRRAPRAGRREAPRRRARSSTSCSRTPSRPTSRSSGSAAAGATCRAGAASSPTSRPTRPRWPSRGRRAAGESPTRTPDGIADRRRGDRPGLAPVRDVTGGRGGATSRARVRCSSCVDSSTSTPQRVRARWDARRGARCRRRSAHRGDGPLALDLRADGPHALVAGTTGAGKSELLQTLVAALARQPPARPAELPVRRLQGRRGVQGLRRGCRTRVGHRHRPRRAPDPARAALAQRRAAAPRARSCSDAGAKDLLELERRRPGDAPAVAGDRRSTSSRRCKTEVPEFVDGVVDIAQRGRSLGVHLILATQRPAGVVSDNIRANTNLRIALRVPSAGRERRRDRRHRPPRGSRASLPGRAFARTGHSELTEFQAAYVGGRTPGADGRRRGDASRPACSATPRSGRARRASRRRRRRPTSSALVAGGRAARRSAPARRRRVRRGCRSCRTISLDALERRDGAARRGRARARRRAARASASAVCALDLERDGTVLIYGTGGVGQDDAAAHDRGRARAQLGPRRAARSTASTAPAAAWRCSRRCRTAAR